MRADRQSRAMIAVTVGGFLVSCLMSLVSCLSLEAAEVQAAPTQTLKVGYVDVAQLFGSYERTKTSDAALEKAGKQKEAELEARMSELKKLRQNLELLNAEAREAKSREIEEKAEELQRFRNATARDLRRERDKIAKDILDDIQGVLKEYAEANGYSIIMDSRSLLYGQAAHDVTKDVLATLNKRMGAAR